MSGSLIKDGTGTYTLDLLQAGTLASSYTLMTFSGTNFSQSDFALELPAGYTGTLVQTATSLSITTLVHGEEPAADESLAQPQSAVSGDLGGEMSGSSLPGSDNPAAAGLSSSSPAPEPGSADLLALGGGALLGWQPRRSGELPMAATL